jgi:rare lipoprotein A (peptidoglycan hydrolase)
VRGKRQRRCGSPALSRLRGLPALLALALLVPVTWSGSAPTTVHPRLAADSGPVSEADLAPEPDLQRLQAQLDDANQRVAGASAAAEGAAGRAVAAGISRQRASLDADRARDQLRTDVRGALIGGPVETVPGWVFGPDPNSVGLLGELRQRQVRHQSASVADLRGALASLDAADRALAAQRDEAVRDATTAELAADHARRLLDAAEQVHANNEAIRARLDAQRKALDAVNRSLIQALAPVQATRNAPDGTPVGPLPTPVDRLPDGSRPDASAAAQAAVLAVLENNPPNALPPGYAVTGEVLDGVASWYGPGFIGSPTSSGVPYDPERLTCAMLAVPLGTVIRVTRPNGASVNLLVNDHGPYVGNRVLDVSMRANRILDLGMGPVHIEVLRRVS